MRAAELCAWVLLWLAQAARCRADVIPGRCYTAENTTSRCDVLKCQEYWGYPPKCIRWGIRVGIWNVLFVPDDPTMEPKRCQLPTGAWPGDERAKAGLTAWMSLGDLPDDFDCSTPYVPGTQPYGVDPGSYNDTRETVPDVLGAFGWQEAMFGVCGMPMCNAAVQKYLEPHGCTGHNCLYGKCSYDAYPLGFQNPVCLNKDQTTANSYLKAAMLCLLIVLVLGCAACCVMAACLKCEVQSPRKRSRRDYQDSEVQQEPFSPHMARIAE